MIAISTGVPTVVNNTTAAQLGAIAGTPFAIPRKPGKGIGPYVNAHFLFSADPGATSYNVMSSIDGTNWTVGQNLVPTLAANSFNILATGLLMRIDQVSKANGVTNATSVMLA